MIWLNPLFWNEANSMDQTDTYRPPRTQTKVKNDCCRSICLPRAMMQQVQRTAMRRNQLVSAYIREILNKVMERDN